MLRQPHAPSLEACSARFCRRVPEAVAARSYQWTPYQARVEPAVSPSILRAALPPPGPSSTLPRPQTDWRIVAVLAIIIAALWWWGTH